MLPDRLQQIKKMLLPYHSVGDIGTDHALLPLSLACSALWNGARIIGTDLSPEPLGKGVQNLYQQGLEKRIELRQGWGLEPFRTGEVEQIIISGLGGRRIVSILERGSPEKLGINHLFLQPQRDLLFLRKWLVQSGWTIVDEELIREKGNFYTVIRTDWGLEERRFFDWEMEIGPLLIAKKVPLLSLYLEEKVQEFVAILEKIRRRKPGHPGEKYWEEKIDLFKGVTQWLFPQKNL